jgi:formimidoylglutamate deiminase
MHRFAEVVTPEILEAVAAQVFVEMVKAGFTSVCEFHYMHHQNGGAPYGDPSEMSMAVIRAAKRAGIGITLLPVLYERGGYAGKPANAGQKRFISTPDTLLDILDRVRNVHGNDPQVRIGVAPHSPRQVTVDGARALIGGLTAMDAAAPIHIHVAEQEKDVEESVAHDGLRPVEWALRQFDVDARWCLVHATHLTPEERRQIAASGAVACICPTTEANLGDGLFPLIDYLGDGGRIAIGSDSNVTVGMIDELRLLEYGQRLHLKRRNLAAAKTGGGTGTRLYLDAVNGGAQSTARPVGALKAGNRADFIVLDQAHPALVGKPLERLLDALVFAATPSVIQEVWIGGIRQVAGGWHVRELDTLDAFSREMRSLNI